MRFFVSLLFSLFAYILIILFLYFALFRKPIKKEVLIHTAIIQPQIKNKKTIKNKIKSLPKQKIKKTIKKTGSKKNITKGGKVDFNDIFKNVNYNVPTKKINLKKENVLSRFKADNVIKNLKKIKNINVNISFKTSSHIKKEKINEIIQKIGDVWYNISNIAGEYATIKYINNNGNVTVYILNSNLPKNKEQQLIEKLKNINFDKNIDLTVKFQTKVSR